VGGAVGAHGAPGRCAIGTYKRLPREKSKPHDDFVNWTVHVVLWLKKHWKSAVEIVVVAGVLFAVVIGASGYWKWRSNKAADALYAAQQMASHSEDQMKALESVVDSYLGTAAGKQALMQLGEIYIEKGRFEDAIEGFRKLAGKSRNNPMLFVAAMYRAADAELASGDPAGAAEIYLKVAADPSNIMSADSRYRAALILENSGNLDEALKLYRQVVDEAEEYDAEAKAKSEERLIWLALKGDNK